jgi:molecular chaperone DnaK (HSP70)
MARLGIDFGTTNTVAVMYERGMITEVQHTAQTGAGTIVQPLFPSAILIEEATGRRWFGMEAERRFGQRGPGRGYVFIPSLKRSLRDYVEGPRVPDAVPPAADPRSCASSFSHPPLAAYDLADLLRSFLQALAASIRGAHAPDAKTETTDEQLEAVITWPANANGAQRHVTRKCFREAGFSVIDTLNEPTASAIELADYLTARQVKKPAREPSAVAVFDLGGGTFDASVVWIDGQDFDVLASGGIENLGGDDLDETLLGMFLDAINVPPQEVRGLTRHALLRQARTQKETISSGTIKRMFINPADFGLPGRPASITVEALYERLRPMLEPAMKVLASVIAQAAKKEPRVTAEGGCAVWHRLSVGAPLIYLVGGSSKLPLVAELVAAAFPGYRVVLSDKPFLSVARGAAICAADRVQYRDVFSRHFGLIRLRDHGRAECFDPIFPAGTPLPRRGEPPLEKVAWYHPRHNIGRLRYLECTSIGSAGLPDGNIRAWSDIRFPYDPSVPLQQPLDRADIVETGRFGEQSVCEVYRCDSDGVITVELRRPSSQDARTYEIFRD